MLQVQSKRFYVDVKQNKRGRFIKIAELSLDGRKNRLTMSMAVAASFRDHLGKFIKFFDDLGEEHSSEENGQLMSETIVRDSHRYYLDLKENRRGRYLRVSQTLNRSMYNMRPQIALPAPGMVLLRDVLNKFMDKYGEGYINEPDENIELPEPKMIRSDNNKVFYFDVNHNERGTFVRVSEVKQLSGLRSSIAVPQSAWASFRDAFSDFLKIMEKPKEDGVTNGTMKERGD